jgi:hypothetical protein
MNPETAGTATAKNLIWPVTISASRGFTSTAR